MRKYIDISAAPSAEQIEMLEKAMQLPIPEDSDLPELSQEDLQQFKRVSTEEASEILLSKIQAGLRSAELHGWISEGEADAILDANN